MAEIISHDLLFKQLITTFFYEFLELFAPKMAIHIDPESIEFLDKETFLNLKLGGVREADIIAKCKFKDAERVIVFHVENQATSMADFTKRMFFYFARFYEKLGLDVYPIVLFSFDQPYRAEADSLKVSFPDLDVLNFKFRVIQLNRLHWRDFIRKPNPIAAALMSKMKFAKKDRPYVKLECLRILATLKLNPAKTRLISAFVHSYLKLSEQENEILNREIGTLPNEEKQPMIRLTNEWIEVGREEGEKLGTFNTLFRLGSKRFGDPTKAILDQLNMIQDKSKLDALCDRLLEVETWQELLQN